MVVFSIELKYSRSLNQNEQCYVKLINQEL
jgi:hypothetical protein